MRPCRIALTAVIALALSSAVASPALAAGVLEPEGLTSVEVRVAGPGHGVAWDMSARNVASAVITPTLRVTEITGDIFEGPNPATLELRTDDDVLYTGNAESLVGEVIEVGEVAVDEVVSVSASVHLPAAAGDEYRTATGVVHWEYAAFAPESPTAQPPAQPGQPDAPEQPGLPVTGTSSPAAIAAWGIAIGLAGVLLSCAARRPLKKREDS
ncbi:hypothetical protein [Leucobacter sp. NPDC077196]|uniref:hypothetical protein n=1 Tax=Leucobacter sp. NPDC077196 TaxID=3154959 RepID=UPI003425FBFB